MKRYIISVVFILACQLAFGQQIAKSTYGKTLLKNATVHTITDGIKENTDVLIDDGKILEVGVNISVSDATVIDCSDHHVYPGFVNSGTQESMGLLLSLPHHEEGYFQERHLSSIYTAILPIICLLDSKGW